MGWCVGSGGDATASQSAFFSEAPPPSPSPAYVTSTVTTPPFSSPRHLIVTRASTPPAPLPRSGHTATRNTVTISRRCGE
ncbi:hypothetical protein E2C01_047674 [Portunus trituberculatus]|uniref:Uncharacterized protein n=1 Tax=Portunus trituberculatus TaxID=210409 RepID=A0A5B7GB63_PORTR|nr:hypothetical protein [Portunus trituberculatus]